MRAAGRRRMPGNHPSRCRPSGGAAGRGVNVPLSKAGPPDRHGPDGGARKSRRAGQPGGTTTTWTSSSYTILPGSADSSRSHGTLCAANSAR